MTVPRKEKEREARWEEKAEKDAALEKVALVHPFCGYYRQDLPISGIDAVRCLVEYREGIAGTAEERCLW